MDKKNAPNSSKPPVDYFALRDGDTIQERLDSVTRRLGRPTFLRDISLSRLPSQAASDSSLSPGEVPHAFHHSHRLHAPPLDEKPLSPLRLAPIRRESPESDRRDTTAKELGVESAILEHDFKYSDVAFPPIDLSKFDQLRVAFLKAWRELEKFRSKDKMASDRGFSTFDHGHNDIVLAVDFNFYGTRMVTASSDHRLKVWDKKDENWIPIDTWRAHDAEVVDVKWNGPFTGSILGSIGEDGKFNIWEEDLLEPPHSSRRFKRIYSIMSETKIPFCSLDFKNLHTETYAALITRDGCLSVFEPVDHDNLGGDWTIMLQKYVCATPSRQDETGFRVAWHKEKVPCWTAVEAGLDKKALSLAVAAMSNVKVFRTDKERKWYQAAELLGPKAVVRDVAWANGSMRGYDILATASKDGAVRIYELSTLMDHAAASAAAVDERANDATTALQQQGRVHKMGGQSGIGIGLSTITVTGAKETRRDVGLDGEAPGRVKHDVKLAAVLEAHGSVWRVAFSQVGDLLVSTGDDGSVKTWKKALTGQWLEYAQIELTANDP